MKIQTCLKYWTEKLTSLGFEEAQSDAFLLIEEVSGISYSNYLMRCQEELSEAQEKRITEMMERRMQHIPVQQIIGHAPFYGREFRVCEAVLTPRFDTENLVAEALTHLREGDRILDVCTGSGCILITLLAEKKGTVGEGLDLSPEALEIAKQNADLHHVDAKFYQSDMLEKASGTYDMIVSNPPYIARGELDTLMREVIEHEPKMALDGGEDGLDFYRILAAQSGACLKNGGWLILEIGYDQGEAVSELLKENQYTQVKVIKDLSGLDRVVCGRKEENHV